MILFRVISVISFLFYWKFRVIRFLVGSFSLLGFSTGRSIQYPKFISLILFSTSVLFRLLHISISIQSDGYFISSICISLLPAGLLLFEFFNTFPNSSIVIYYLKVLGYWWIFLCWFLIHRKTVFEIVALLWHIVFHSVLRVDYEHILLL